MNVLGLEALFSCKGYRVDYGRTDGQVLQVNLLIDRRFSLKCPCCQSSVSVNRSYHSLIRDLPIGPIKQILIKIPVRQGRCWTCGKTHTFKPDIAASGPRITTRLMQLAAALCQYMPVVRVAEYLAVSDNTIRHWNQVYLETTLGPPDVDGLRYLLIDEKSIGKRHCYVTIVLNALNSELLHMAPGKKKASLQAFFDTLTDEQKRRIRAVCVDRSGSYTQCVEAALPDAQIAYDKFHLVNNLNAVIDSIRRDLWNQARKNKDLSMAELIKGQRYNLLRNRGKNTPEQQERLDALLRLNAPLSEAYLLLDSFKHLLATGDVLQVRQDLRDWIAMAGQSCRHEIVRFAENLTGAVDRIVNAIRYRLNNGLIERFNRKIGIVINRSCGCKNLRYLFLNLRQLAKKPIPL